MGPSADINKLKGKTVTSTWIHAQAVNPPPRYFTVNQNKKQAVTLTLRV